MIIKDIAEYEETDSELAKYTIANLHSEIERLKIDYQQANDIIVEQTNEIENLTNDLEREKSQVKEYGTRLLKAIEFLNDECMYSEELGYCDDLWCGRVQELVNKLEGVDKK